MTYQSTVGSKEHGDFLPPRGIFVTDRFIHMAMVHSYEMGDFFGSKDGWIDYARSNHRVLVVQKSTNQRMYLGNFESLISPANSCDSPSSDCWDP